MSTESETEAKIRYAAEHGVQIRISPKQAMAIMGLLQRLRNDAHAPYQCYWRDRALRAEQLEGSSVRALTSAVTVLDDVIDSCCSWVGRSRVIQVRDELRQMLK